jgi:hypothetical protein
VNLWHLFRRFRRQSRQPNDPYFKRFAAAIASLIFVVLYQIVLCLILGCSGISIIWCACAGWIVWELQRVDQPPRGVASSFPPEPLAVLSLDALTILYYSITAEAITTVAHFCAILLGILLSVLVSWLVPNSGFELLAETADEAPSAS